jgi:hypothetical protein
MSNSQKHFFNANIVPNTRRAEEAFEEIRRRVTEHEVRARALNEDQKARFDAAGRAIVANLIAAKGEPVFITLDDPIYRKASRYSQTGYRQLKAFLEGMKHAGLLLVRKGRITDEGPWLATELRPTKQLDKLLAIPVNEVREDMTSEIVILKDYLSDEGSPVKGATLQDYDDTEWTNNLRDKVRRINAHLVDRVEMLDAEPHVQTNLKRYFCGGSFEMGGRFFGHWAQSTRKTERDRLRIDGDNVLALDYPSMMPMLAYIRAGKRIPEGDLYDMVGHGRYSRAGIKRILAALLSRQGEMKRFPVGVKGEYFDEDTKVDRVVDHIARAHPGIADLFGKRIGLKLMRTESDILLQAMMVLVDRGVGFVPLHDCLLVPANRAWEANLAMMGAFERITEVQLPKAISVTAYGPLEIRAPFFDPARAAKAA